MNRKDCTKLIDHLGVLRDGKASIEAEAKDIQTRLLEYYGDSGLLVFKAKLYTAKRVDSSQPSWNASAIEACAARAGVDMSVLRDVREYSYLYTKLNKD